MRTATDGRHCNSVSFAVFQPGIGAYAGTNSVYQPKTEGVNPQPGVALDGYFYFSAQTYQSEGLYRVPMGTAAGTTVLKDLLPGTGGSFPCNFKATSNLLYFIASDPANGQEDWTSDGTAANTQRLKDIQPGAGSSVSSPQFTQLGAWVYFVANGGTNGIELWRSDGTEGNTTMFRDISPGSDHGSPEYLTVAGDKLYFAANDGINQKEPWVTDGVTAMMVKNLHPSSGFGSSPNSFFATGNGSEVYFTAFGLFSSSSDDGFYRTDGTEAGTQLLAKLSLSSLSKIGDQILFAAYTWASRGELWSFGEADCGDAPNPAFPTLLASGGACHQVDPSVISPILGSASDIDSDGQPTDTADGNDMAGIDDEDGVSFPTLFALGNEASMDVTLSTAGQLNVWFDWTGIGNWDATEDWVVKNQELPAGTHSLLVTVPTFLPEGQVNTGTIHARFRVSTKPQGGPDGITFDGEVEDYLVNITGPGTPGDVTKDGNIDLTNTILCLKVLVGSSAPDASVAGDVNNDGKLGLAEVIYVLNEVANN